MKVVYLTTEDKVNYFVFVNEAPLPVETKKPAFVQAFDLIKRKLKTFF